MIKFFDLIFTKQTSTDRYYKNVFILIIFLSLNIGATLFLNDNTSQSLKLVQNNQEENSFTIISFIQSNNTNSNNNLNLSESVHLWSYDYISKIIGLFWIIGVVLYLLKVSGAYFYSQKLLNSSHYCIPNYWYRFIKEKAEQLNINKSIKLIESKNFNSAFTYGFIKPIIVFPIGFFSTLPQDQLEAVILHELYHIKHNDYIVNMLVMLVEVVLFYHPLMWYLAKNIRYERENRCDDHVIKLINKKVYANALVNMEAYRQSISLAIPFSNKNSNLKIRIMRIFDQKPERNIGLKPIISLMLSFILLTSFTLFKIDNYKVKESIKNVSTDIFKPDENDETENNLIHDKDSEEQKDISNLDYKSSENKDAATEIYLSSDIINSDKENLLDKKESLKITRIAPRKISQTGSFKSLNLDYLKPFNQDNLKLLEQLIEKYKNDKDSNIKIKLDGKLIDFYYNFEKYLIGKYIKEIRIVMKNKSSSEGTIEILTIDEEKSNKENNSAKNKVLIKVAYLTPSGNYTDEVSMESKEGNVLGVLGVNGYNILYVIDGEAQELGFKPDLIVPNDIKNIVVLKGEKAIDKYGQRAKNGAIEINLK
ncbi:M56 family metallopeptidase [Marivirga arenosa]|uniref:M56 family metallopeptidase n=1 Tax=Marivirga arenosa TaxID=3059076 RepID=A0AA51R861_9BACT|nr:M56 family metallopeptidase [Marivirga sp. ABR2-2]WMN06291.1 M56 family metallopeptidase [Marivirga sp. ABR2-2]